MAPICDSLPSFHALNGCDYTASFLRKAKWRPFQTMKTKSRFTTAIGQLGDSDVMATVKEYVCYIYMECAISELSMMPDFIFSKEIRHSEKEQSIRSLLLTTLPMGSSAKAKNKLCCTCLETCKGIQASSFWTRWPRMEMDDKRLKMAWFTGPNAPSDICH